MLIPTGRLDPNALALLNMLPLPNAVGQSPNYNFTRQETSDNPRFNNLVRLDARPSGNNTYWATVRTFKSSQYGSEITAGPAKWVWKTAQEVSSTARRTARTGTSQ